MVDNERYFNDMIAALDQPDYRDVAHGRLLEWLELDPPLPPDQRKRIEAALDKLPI